MEPHLCFRVLTSAVESLLFGVVSCLSHCFLFLRGMRLPALNSLVSHTAFHRPRQCSGTSIHTSVLVTRILGGYLDGRAMDCDAEANLSMLLLISVCWKLSVYTRSHTDQCTGSRPGLPVHFGRPFCDCTIYNGGLLLISWKKQQLKAFHGEPQPTNSS